MGSPSSDWKRLKYVKVGQVAQDKSRTDWKMTYAVNCPQVFFLYGLDLKSSWVETASVNVGWVLQNCLQTFSVNVGWMSYNYEG